eukprot:TRINITY_DN92601_c0_g1_i1.p1 TRINITY_DN92601_c0_g1~~TRINITY_DN92601_c0_g1_i1.p1  ORF type:complete len:495 (+),score=84.07 TRINITY_DN92601_c0_g1_i1:119-1603(+)
MGSSRLAALASNSREAVKQQAAFAYMLVKDGRFRGPMLCLWFEDFGGSLHMPVLTFFFLESGATAVDIGIFGTCRSFGVFLLSPVYGRAVDRYGITMPLLFCTSMCGLACMVRGWASSLRELYIASIMIGMGGGSSWSMVKGHIARHTDEADRPTVVAGLRLQMILISLSKVMYPLLDLGIRAIFKYEEDLPRYRMTIMTCMSFCWIGIGAIVACRPGHNSAKLSQDGHTSPQSAARLCAFAGGMFHCGVSLAVLVAAIVASACCLTAVATLWPLLLKTRFQWGAQQFAYVSAAETLTTAAALTAYPRAVGFVGGGRRGGMRVAEVLSAFAACMILGAYCVVPAPAASSNSSLAVIAHVLPALAATAALGALGPCLEAAASLQVRAEHQGIAMGALNGAYAIGGLFGPLLGTSLWTFSYKSSAAPLLADGRLPYLAVSGLLVVIAACLRCCLAGETGKEAEVASAAVEPSKIGNADSVQDEFTDDDKLLAPKHG